MLRSEARPWSVVGFHVTAHRIVILLLSPQHHSFLHSHLQLPDSPLHM